MFSITINRAGLQRAGALALCGIAIAAAALTVHFTGGAAQASAPVTTTIESTQDIQAYFLGFGLEVDPAAITADKVKVPRKWDDSFSAFNKVVAQSGQDLTGHKGKTVEKWLAELPALSAGDQTVYGVLLVRNKKAAGAYLLEKPSGNVTGLADVVQSLALQNSQGQPTSGEADQPEQQVSLDLDVIAGEDGFPVE